MRLTKRSWLAMSFLSLFSGAAVAQSDFYLFGSIGNSNADGVVGIPPADPFGLSRVDDRDSRNFTVGGGYEFNEHIALEAAYQDFGSFKTTCQGPICSLVLLTSQPEVAAAALSVSFVGSLRINDRLDGYGRLGLTSWEFDGSSAYTFDGSREDLHYGVGLRWSFDDSWKIFGEYARVDLDVDAVSVGVRYGF